MMFTISPSLIFLLLLHLTGCHRPPKQQRLSKRPPKLDIGFIVDTSPYMTQDVKKAVELMKAFGNHLSVSSGTTRFALLNINNTGAHRHFLFSDIVNRECLMRQIRKFSHLNASLVSTSIIGKDNIAGDKNFRGSLKKALSMLRSSSNQVSNQRIIYFLVTNSISKVKTAKLKRFGVPYELLPVFVGSRNDVDLRNASSRFFKYNNKKDFKPIRKALELEDKIHSSCTANGSVRDECNRACTCLNGTLKKCFRIRKEFTEMTSREQKIYLEAYKYLTTTSPYKERYEEFVFMHFRYFCYGVHSKSLFLPWHRWYLSQMEDMLREIDCRVTIPYWDWSLVSEDAWNVPKLWSKDRLGGDGDEKRGFCVQDGMFQESKWKTPYWEDPMQIITTTVDQMKGDIDDVNAELAFCLRRGMHGTPPGVNSIRNILKIPPRRFHDFNLHIIHNYHNIIHNMIGGTMSTDYAANAPEFWFHHGFLDKIWYMWQSKSGDHKYVHFLQRNATKMMGCKYTRRDYIDSHSLPRCIRVKYSEFPNPAIKSNKREKRSAKHDKVVNSQNINATSVLDKQQDIDDNIDHMKMGKSYVEGEFKLDPIDDMGRTSHAFWDGYLKKKWDNDFPRCRPSHKDKVRAHRLHYEIDES